MARSDRASVEALKHAIVEAALRRFADAGVEATSISAIARDVGISKQALMHHYPSKQRLRDAVTEQLASELGPLVPKFLEAVVRDERLERVVDEMVDFFSTRAHYARFLLRDALDDARDEVETAFGFWVQLAADYIRREQQAGRMPQSADPEATIAQLGMLLLTTFAVPVRSTRFAAERIEGAEWRRRMVVEARRIIAASFRP